MPLQVFALAVVVGDAVPGIEFQAAGDVHIGDSKPKVVGWIIT
jgi:hypothetical protein